MRKLLVIPASFIWVLFAQNDGLVKTYYPSKALKTEGNYSNGVRDGLWTFWYEGELFEDYGEDRNFGHLAYAVDDIYALCQRLSDQGVKINRPPRDGRMAFIRSPDNISIELLQEGEPLSPAEPWLSMENSGHW